MLEVHGGMGRWGGWGGFALFGLYKGLHMAVFAVLAGVLMKRWWAIPAVAALWTGIERTHGPFGFAWLDLGNAGINMPVPMRLAPITGVYGLSFVFAMLGCAVAGIALQRPRRELAWLVPIPLLLVLPAPPRPAAPTERALVVQPNIDTEMNWTTDTLRETEEKKSKEHSDRTNAVNPTSGSESKKTKAIAMLTFCPPLSMLLSRRQASLQSTPRRRQRGRSCR